MTASWHVVAKLLTVSRMSKVDYQNKVLPNIFRNILFCVLQNKVSQTDLERHESE